MSNTAKISDQVSFNCSDFSERWRKARVVAIEKNLDPEDCKSAHVAAGDKTDLLERELLLRVKSEQQELVLRSVFDHSRQLGLSVVRHLGLSWDLSDIVEILPRLGSPCFSGQWRSHNHAQVLQRSSCAELADLGAQVCDFWREALDGLVVGVGENERFARHRSSGHGDSECLDVLFVEEFTPPRVVALNAEERKHKYGQVSSELASALEPIQQNFKKMKVNLVLEGESEGVLFYRLDADEGVLCGAGGKLLHDSLGRDIAKLFPRLVVRDASPLAVYGGST